MIGKILKKNKLNPTQNGSGQKFFAFQRKLDFWERREKRLFP
jgi:hypothetical protein